MNQAYSKVIAERIGKNFTSLFPELQMSKMKITHRRVIGDGCIHLRILPISQSVLYQVLNAVRDGMFKRNCLMEK